MGKWTNTSFDKNIISFSPEGRIYQVEYAIRAADISGSTCIAIKGLNTVCMIEEEKFLTYDIPSLDSISLQLNRYTGCVCSGIPGDLSYLVSEIIQEFCQFNEKNGHEISIDQLANSISIKNQILTQQCLTRLLGVKTIFFGIDKEIGPMIIKMDSSGYFTSHSICAIGGKSNDFKTYIQKNDISHDFKYFNYEKIVTFTISLIQNILKNDLRAINLKITVISLEKEFQILSLFEIENYLEKINKINKIVRIRC